MISLENVSKKFGTGTYGVSDITLAIDKGEFVFLVGPTGSGKTTIFRLLIREYLPTQGTIIVNSWDVVKLPGKKVADLRKKIGVVFQDLKLLSDRTILENTTLPLDIAGVKPNEAIRKAKETLERVGISEHINKFPVQLSGGEVQRAAVARALILSPDIILADEPTGNLDEESSWEIVKLLSEINEAGTTVVMATHNREVVKKMDRRMVELSLGTIVNDKKGSKEKTKENGKKDEEEEEKNPPAEKSDKKTEDKENKKESPHPASVTQSGDEKKNEDSKKTEKEEDGKKIRTDDFEKALKE